LFAVVSSAFAAACAARPMAIRSPHRMTALRAALTIVAALGAALTAAQEPKPAASANTRHVYVSAIDKKGDPVPDLSHNDVTVKEDGTARDVVAVQRATAPIDLALLVDDTGPGINFIRESVGQFMQQMAGRGAMTVVSTGGRNTTLVDYTRSVDEWFQAARRLAPKTTSGAYLLDGLHDAIEGLNRREAERPVIVVLTLEGAEFSGRRADRLLDELTRSRAVLHVVSFGKPSLKTMTSWNEMPSQSARENLDENINRRKFLEDGSRVTGGRFAQVLVDSGLPDAMRAVAADLTSQYVVVYRRPETASPKKLNISATRSGVKIRARAGV
jgi:VWFA-related protein